MTNPERDIDLDDPQHNALTTPELDGDDIQVVEDERAPHHPTDGSEDDPDA
jgi:hypothetical protein